MRIVFSPESYNLGETTRCIEVAHAARARGHEVLFHVYSERHLPLIVEAGHPVHHAAPRMSRAQAEQVMAVDQGRGIRHPFDLGTVRRRVAAEIDALRGADAVVIGSNPSMFISARAAGVPLYYVRTYFMSSSYFLDVPDGVRAGRAVRAVAARVTWKPRSFARVAAEHGVRLPRRTVEAMTGDIDLIASLPPCLDGRPLADRDVAVGPVHFRSSAPLPEFLERRDRSRPLVYVSLGSSGSPRVLGQILMQLDQAGHEVLVGGGVAVPEEVSERLSERVHRAGMVPEHRLHGHVDAAIIHGGEGTVQAMCLAGVPFAGYPMQAEQRWNITECVRWGTAERLRRADLRRGRVPGIAERLLHDEGMRSAAADLRERMAGLDGPHRAVLEIERRGAQRL